MNTTIRRATLEDVPAVCALSQALFEHDRQFTDEQNIEWSHSKDGVAFFSKSIKSRSSFILLALDGEKIVGYILMTMGRFSWRAYNPMAEVVNLCVDPLYRGQGVGTKLFDHVKAIMKKRGVKRISVQAISADVRAIKFYETLGFKDFTVTRLMTID